MQSSAQYAGNYLRSTRGKIESPQFFVLKLWEFYATNVSVLVVVWRASRRPYCIGFGLAALGAPHVAI